MNKITFKQTNKILETLKKYKVEVIDTDYSTIMEGCSVIDEVYFNEKINEALGEYDV